MVAIEALRKLLKLKRQLNIQTNFTLLVPDISFELFDQTALVHNVHSTELVLPKLDNSHFLLEAEKQYMATHDVQHPQFFEQCLQHQPLHQCLPPHRQAVLKSVEFHHNHSLSICQDFF